MLVEFVLPEQSKPENKTENGAESGKQDKAEEKAKDGEDDGKDNIKTDDSQKSSSSSDSVNEEFIYEAISDNLIKILFESVVDQLAEKDENQANSNGDKSSNVQDFVSVFQLMTSLLEAVQTSNFQPLVICTTNDPEKEKEQEQKEKPSDSSVDDKSSDNEKKSSDNKKVVSEKLVLDLRRRIQRRIEDMLFSESLFLNESNEPFRPSPQQAHMSEEDLDQIELLYDTMQSKTQRYIKSVDPAAAKLHVNFYVPAELKYPEYGMTEDIIDEFLKKDSLGKDDIYEKMKKMPFTILVAMKKQVRVPYKNGTMRKSGKPLGTTGESKTDVKQITDVFKKVYKSLSGVDIKEKDDFNIFEIVGKSKKIKYFIKDKTEAAKYDPENLNATMHIFAITFNSIPYRANEKPEGSDP